MSALHVYGSSMLVSHAITSGAILHTHRTSVFGRRTLPVLCSTCIWRVTRYRVNRPLQVSQLGQLNLSSSQGRLMSSKLQSDVRCGGAIWWMLTGCRPGVVDWCGGVFASCCHGSNCSLARAMDGRIYRCSTICSCQSTATSNDCNGRLVRFPCKMCYIRITSFSSYSNSFPSNHMLVHFFL